MLAYSCQSGVRGSSRIGQEQHVVRGRTDKADA
jgi:hypothetical protein